MTVLDRAYSTLQIKAVDEDARILTGVATTPSPDRMGDIVEPMGVTYKNPLPLLWQHRHDQPIGSVKFDKPTTSGITFTASVAKIDEPGTLKDRLDEAWLSLKTGLVRAFSIGFIPTEYSWMDDGGMRFITCEVIELSAVTIPANADCTLTTMRSMDLEARGARRRSPPIELAPAVEPDTSAELETPAEIDGGPRVVRLAPAARVRAPFVINRIIHTR